MIQNTNGESGFSLNIIMLITVVVVLVGALGYTYYQSSSKNSVTNSSENNTAKKKAVDVEIEISDSDKVNKLSKEVEYLSATSTGAGPYIIDNLFAEQKISNVSDADKLQLALASLYHEDQFSSIPSNQEITINNGSYLEGINNEGKMINSLQVDDRYSKIFGISLTAHPDTQNDICPNFLFDSKNKVYYSWANCGGTGFDGYTFNYKYSEKAAEAYVYTSVGHGQGSNIYKGFDTEETLSASEAAVFDGVNESNYNEFSKFKWTFTKNSEGNYYFVSVEKINE